LWRDPRRVIVEARSESEPRFAIIAQLRGKVWTGIFTPRGDSVRIISVRRSRHGEEQGYYQS
ncbi:BrnT family toxin, partial [Verrucomicrobiaceae bacterium N1E253]|nr:BrnT family toxin [Oceaniferula marina]